MTKKRLRKGVIVKVKPSDKWKGTYKDLEGGEFKLNYYVDNYDGRFYISPFDVNRDEANCNGKAIFEPSDLIYVRDTEFKEVNLPTSMKWMLRFMYLVIVGCLLMLKDVIQGKLPSIVTVVIIVVVGLSVSCVRVIKQSFK